jgi:hypothetical protein
MFRRVGVGLAALAAAFILTGAGTHQPVTNGPEDPASAHAVAVITGLEEGDVGAAIPPDYAEVVGYQPELVRHDGGLIAIDPTGDCSSPLGESTYDFGLACQQHDLGYDLLRYAAASGGELGPWARRAMDDQFATALRDRCGELDDDPGCHGLAWVYDTAVRANSWRQGQGVPVAENFAPYLGIGGAAVAVIAARLAVAKLRRRSVPDHAVHGQAVREQAVREQWARVPAGVVTS